MNLTQIIQEKAFELGFDIVNAIPISPSMTIDVYTNWLNLGYAGKMSYLEKHLNKKKDLRYVMPETLSLITLAINYHTLSLPQESKMDPMRGIISSYAWGDDYHEIIREKLEKLRNFIENTVHHQKESRVYVDTGPILEREYAQRAGLGWFGKNSMLINKQKGSWLFLSEILLDIELKTLPSLPQASCGTCTHCIDACPTNAIVADRQVNSQDCISYLTIELKGNIPSKLRPAIGNLIFGCDICQEVCPWNRKAPLSQEPAFQPRAENILPHLIDLMMLTQEEFSRRFKKSPIKRTKRRGFLRNVAIALGNWGSPQAIPALIHGLNDMEPLIRSHSAWALGQISSAASRQALKAALVSETESTVQQEIQEALANHDTPLP